MRGRRRIRLTLLIMETSSCWSVSGQKLARSFRLPADQKYSIGFNSGAYGGNHSGMSQWRWLRKKAVDALDLCTASRSMRSMSFPRTCRRRYFTNRMNSCEQTLPDTIRRYNFGSSPRGVVIIVPATERTRQCPGEAIIGVCPRGAQVR